MAVTKMASGPKNSFSSARSEHAEHLLDRGSQGERDAVLAPGLEGDGQILVVEVDLEAGREVVLEEVPPPHLHDPVGGESAREDVQDERRVDARLRAEHERLAHGGVGDADDNLVAGLHDLPRAVRTYVDDGLAERLEDRTGALEVGRRAADHDRERPLAGADVPA